LEFSVGLLHPKGSKQSEQRGKGLRQFGQLDILAFGADEDNICGAEYGLCFAVTPKVNG